MMNLRNNPREEFERVVRRHLAAAILGEVSNEQLHTIAATIINDSRLAELRAELALWFDTEMLERFVTIWLREMVFAQLPEKRKRQFLLLAILGEKLARARTPFEAKQLALEINVVAQCLPTQVYYDKFEEHDNG